jgi:hypothetical protein
MNAVTGEVDLYDMAYRYSTSSDGEQEVDWKRLVQFALMASSDWEQYAILLARFARAVLRHLRGKQIVRRRQHANFVRNAR